MFVLVDRCFLAILFVQNADIGEKAVWYSNKVWVEGEDAAAVTEGQVVTLINWGNVLITKINRLASRILCTMTHLKLSYILLVSAASVSVTLI